MRWVLFHLLIYLLTALICLLHTAHLHISLPLLILLCSFTSSLTHPIPNSWKRGSCPWYERIHFIQFQSIVQRWKARPQRKTPSGFATSALFFSFTGKKKEDENKVSPDFMLNYSWAWKEDLLSKGRGYFFMETIKHEADFWSAVLTSKEVGASFNSFTVHTQTCSKRYSETPLQRTRLNEPLAISDRPFYSARSCQLLS